MLLGLSVLGEQIAKGHFAENTKQFASCSRYPTDGILLTAKPLILLPRQCPRLGIFQGGVDRGRFVIGDDFDLMRLPIAGGEHEGYADRTLGRMVHVKAESPQALQPCMSIIPVQGRRRSEDWSGGGVGHADTKRLWTGKNQGSRRPH